MRVPNRRVALRQRLGPSDPIGPPVASAPTSPEVERAAWVERLVRMTMSESASALKSELRPGAPPPLRFSQLAADERVATPRRTVSSKLRHVKEHRELAREREKQRIAEQLARAAAEAAAREAAEYNPDEEDARVARMLMNTVVKLQACARRHNAARRCRSVRQRTDERHKQATLAGIHAAKELPAELLTPGQFQAEDVRTALWEQYFKYAEEGRPDDPPVQITPAITPRQVRKSAATHRARTSATAGEAILTRLGGVAEEEEKPTATIDSAAAPPRLRATLAVIPSAAAAPPPGCLSPQPALAAAGVTAAVNAAVRAAETAAAAEPGATPLSVAMAGVGVYVRGSEEVRLELARWNEVSLASLEKPSLLDKLSAKAEVADAQRHVQVKQSERVKLATRNATAKSRKAAETARAAYNDAYRLCEDVVNTPGTGWHHRREAALVPVVEAEEKAVEAEAALAALIEEANAICAVEDAKVAAANEDAAVAADEAAKETAVRAARSAALATVGLVVKMPTKKNEWAGVLHRRARAASCDT